jgi:hypothetical protein
MAQARKSKAKRAASRTRRRTSHTSGSRRTVGNDAIALLKSDHREVEEWFKQFEKARSSDRKQELAEKICMALKAHTTIEEEIFYPAYLEGTDDQEMHHEAEVEHNGAKRLIAEIEGSSPDDEYYDAKVTVLSEMIKHHVKEEEKRDGMFARAKKADMDLKALGEELRARKREIMGESESSRSGEDYSQLAATQQRRNGSRAGRPA